MKLAPVALLLAATALAVPERWMHNPRERTGTAIEEWKRKDYAAADHHLEEALELAGETPRALYNAGTGRLGAGAPGAALPLLSRAAEAAKKDPGAQALRPESLYNLGNAHLGAGDAAHAADSYRAALRIRPDHTAAKHNLELALRELDKERQRQLHNEQPSQGQDQQQQQQGGGGQGGAKGAHQQGGGGGGEQEDPSAQPQPQGPSQGREQRRSPRLPDFDPQKDMSADQAASLLEAVENLEREQRRAQAEQARRERARTATEKDW